MITVQPVSFLEWNRAPWRADLDAAVADYLRRSGEEITEQEEWEVLNLAMLGRGDLLLLAAVEDDETLLGYCLLRLLPGTKASGPFVQVWQVYVVPGRAKLYDLFKLAWPQIEAWARAAGASRLSMVTRRMSVAYGKLLASLGFRPYALMYELKLQGGQ